jgi:hypothetical protein
MSTTARFALPLLHAGQAQKELSHNEALTLIDALLHGCVEAIGGNIPPEAPEAGQSWIVGADPEGDWADAANALAIWTGGGWRLVPARDGMTIWVRDQGLYATHLGGWATGVVPASEIRIGDETVVSARQAAIENPAGGSSIDLEAREAIGGILSALRAHGLIGS